MVFVWLWEVLGNACLCASPLHNTEGLLGLCVLHEHWCRCHWLAHVVQVVGSFCLAKFIHSFNKYLHCILYMPSTVLGIWEAPGSKTDRAPALVRLHGHVFSSAVEYRVCRGAQMWEERLLCLWHWERFHMRKDTGWGLECEWDLPEHTGAGLENRIPSVLFFTNKAIPEEVTQRKRHLQVGLGRLKDFEPCAKGFGLCICSLVFRPPLPPVSNSRGAIHKDLKMSGAPRSWALPLFIGHGVHVRAQSCLTLGNPMDCSPPASSVHGFPAKNTGAGCHFLLQGIFPNPGIRPVCPALAGGFFTAETPRKLFLGHGVPQVSSQGLMAGCLLESI